MAHVVEKRIYLRSRKEVVLFQLMSYVFLHDLKLSDCDMKCLVSLGVMGKQDLSSFCINPVISDEKIKDSREYYRDHIEQGTKVGLYRSAQAVRNIINKYYDMGLVLKEGKSRKKIQLHPDLEIFTPDGSVILDYQLAYVETQES